ncbi:MAG: hypothetical protein LBH50_04825, partial [Spirochaetaceae bacterium]|nr:hypothetical protein [Spirochaetaceae bacterium]
MNITAVKYLSVLLCAVPALPSAAATVYIMALETGRTEAADGNAAEIWETGMMDAFFEAGHIVSNAPSLRISRADDVEFEEAAKKELEDAA